MCQSLTHVCLGTWDPRMDQQPETEVPPSDRVSAGSVRRGVLQKLSGRGWLFSGSWKKRFCVLTKQALYYYEKEHSSGRDKTCGVLNLEYYDVCEEDPKRPLTFFLDSSVKAFFDNRHQFCAESSEDLERWIAAIRISIEEARRSRKRRTHEVAQEGSRTPDCLVGANKDRVKGPQGRRPPQRKSLMPASRSDEMDLDGRQRSVSLSGPQRGGAGLELPPVTEGKWLSLSMEEVDLEKDPSEGAQRSSSAADIPQQEGAHRRAGPRPGNLLTQHAALTRELEMRLKVGLVNRSPCCKEEDEERTEVEEERTEDEDQVKEVLLQVKTALKDVENVKAEYSRALSELQEAKRGFLQLQEQYKEALDKLPQ